MRASVRASSATLTGLAICALGQLGLLGIGGFAQPAHAETEWPAYGGAEGGGHYSDATQINQDNVRKLKLAWTHRSGDFVGGTQVMAETVSEELQASRPSSFITTPIMVRDTLYYCTPFNRVVALDPGNGEEKWIFDPGVDMSQENLTNCRGVSSWVSPDTPDEFCGHRILTATLDSRLIALDGKSGKPCNDFGTNGEVDLTEGLTPHEGSEYGVTSAPAIIGNLVVTGAYVTDSIRTDIPSGVVRAYNVKTGKFTWGWNPVHPDQAERDDQQRFTPGTTNVWSTISVDSQRGLVIVPTGNTSPDYYGGDRDGKSDYYSSSVVALDARSGEVVWNYQTVHHDIWDFDVPAQPTLVDVTIGGTTRPAVVQVTKMGLTFVLDRETGKPLHPVEERAVPQEGAVEGEYLSATQPFPLKPAPLHKLSISPDDAWGFTFWDRGRCRKRLKALKTGPIYTPPSLQGTVFYPSNLGGNNWGAPAVDPKRRIMIANTKHTPIEIRLVPREECTGKEAFPQRGTKYCAVMDFVLSPFGAPCTAPPWSTLAAVDLESGELLWQIPFGSLKHMAPWPVNRFVEGALEMGGPIITAGGLVFIAAASDGYFRAYNVDTGEEVWKEELPATGNAVPMTYMYKGQQYVVIAAGGHFTSPLPSSDHVLAFRLPDA